MPQIGSWLWDDTNKKWVKQRGTSTGALSIHAIVEALNDIDDVEVAAPGDGEALVWDAGAGDWVAAAPTPAAHKNSHDPIDGSDKLDTAAPVKVGAANAIGTSHSLARADHVHEREHAIYTDAAAKAAAVLAGVITDAETKAPTHDAVYDVKTTADAAQPAATDAAAAVTAMGALADDNPLHHDRYTDAEAVGAIEADDNLPLASITFIIDGGGSAITTGEKGHLRIPFACTINRVTMLADRDGAIVVDIWKWDYANFPPTNTQTITSATPPTITATGRKSEDSTLSGWTTAITADDILAFNVDSCATIQRVTISLKVTKT